MQLDPYQIDGAQWLAEGGPDRRRHVMLGDVPGLGKTAQAIRAADLIEAKRILVVAPAILRYQWAAEIDRFCRNQEYVGKTSVISSSKDFNLNPEGWTVTSYELAAIKRNSELLNDHNFDLIICDEAHMLANYTSKRAKAILPILRSTNMRPIVNNKNRSFFLTGTPVRTSVLDLYPFFRTSGLYSKTMKAYRETFTDGYEGSYGYVVTRQLNLTDMARLKKRLMLRRTFADVGYQLPKLRVSTLSIAPSEHPIDGHRIIEKLPEMDQKLTKHFEKKRIEDVLGNAHAMSSVRRELGMLKVIATAQLIMEELEATSQKIVVFGIYQIFLKYMKAYLHKYNPQLLYGGSDDLARNRALNNFHGDPKCRVLVGQINAAGTGLNLTNANSVWIVEPSWVPADNDQAIARCLRRGQERPVHARFVMLAGTMDETVNRVLARKVRNVQELYEL